MNDRSVTVTLGQVLCRDTESIHSSDKFLLAGAVKVDGQYHPFVMPILRINDYESRTYPDDLAQVYSGNTDATEIEVGLAAWDVDTSEGYLEDRDNVLHVAQRITDEVQGIPFVEVGASWLNKFLDIATSVIDQFVSWDRDDMLLRYIDVRAVDGPPFEPRFDEVEVAFARHEEPDHAGYDYVLKYTIQAEYRPSIFGEGTSAAHVTMEPLRGTTLQLWSDDWVGDDLSVSITAEPPNLRLGERRLDVEVTETAPGNGRITRSPGVGVSRPAQPAGGRTGNTVLGTGPRESVIEALGGRAGQDRVKPELGKDLRADHLRLSDGATVEMHALHNRGERFGEALVYRSNNRAGVLVGRPEYVVLHRRRNL